MSLFDNEIFETAKVLGELRKFRHDYKNQLFGLISLLENEEYDRALEYARELNGKIERLVANKCSYSDNLLIDAILQKLALKCQKEGIMFDATVIAGNDFPLSDLDICSVFGNVADNAVEAVFRQSADNERFIRFSTSRREKWLTITAENSFDGEILTDKDGKIVTSKTDMDFHGIGLNSIKSTVESVGGTVKVCAEDGVFTLSMIFPR